MSIASAMRAGMMLGQGLGRRVDMYQAENELEEEEKQGVGIIDKAAETSFDDFQKRLKEQERVNANAVSQGLITQEYSDNELNKLRASAPALPSIRQGYNEDERARRLAQLYDAQLRSSGDSAYADQLRESRNVDRESGIRRRGLEQTYQQNQKMNPLLIQSQQATNKSLNLTNELADQTFDANVGSAQSAAELAGSQARVAKATEQDVIEAAGLANEDTQADIDAKDQQYTQSRALFEGIQEKQLLDLEEGRFKKEVRNKLIKTGNQYNAAMTPGEGRRDAVNGLIGGAVPLFNDNVALKDSDNVIKQDPETGDYFMYSGDGKTKGTNMTEWIMQNPEGLMTAKLYADSVARSGTEEPTAELNAWLARQSRDAYWASAASSSRYGSMKPENMAPMAETIRKDIADIYLRIQDDDYQTPEARKADQDLMMAKRRELNALHKAMAQRGIQTKIDPNDPNNPANSGDGDKTPNKKGQGLTRKDYQSSGFNLPTTPGQLASDAYNATVDATSRYIVQPVGDTISGINTARAQTQSDQKDVNYRNMAPGINDAFKQGLAIQQSTVDAMMREDPKYLLSVGIDPEVVIALQQLKMAGM